MNYTIKEDFTLPSHGKLYSVPVNDRVSLRSMTTLEEMKRLAPSEHPYKMMSEVIDDCLIDKPGISSYDMCIGDYQFLLHKLRIVTYGPEYKMDSVCPYCGTANIIPIDLGELSVSEFSEDLKGYLEFTLPKTQRIIELNIQTPRMFDEIAERKQQMLQKSEDSSYDPSLLITLEALIKSIDGKKLDPGKLSTFVRTLPMADTNMILKAAEKINMGVGVNTKVENTCKKCNLKYNTTFRITSEFFGPSI